MYAEHVPAISHAMREDVEVFRRGVMFAVLSARMPVRNVPAMLDDLERERAESVYLFGWKRSSYRHVYEHAREFKSQKRLSAKAIRKHVDRYVSETLGKSQEYWDAWCAYVAPDHKLTPYEVSALHLAILPDDYVPF